MEGCSLWDAVTIGAIGATKLLSIGHSHGIAGRLGSRASRTHVLLVILALYALFLAFAGEEAQAQQLSQAQPPAVDGEAAGETSRMPVEAAPTEETSPGKTSPADTSPVEPASQPALIKPKSEAPAGEPSPTAPGPALVERGVPVEVALSEPVSGPALRSDPVLVSTPVLAERVDDSETVDPYSMTPAPELTASEPASEREPVPPVDRDTASGPVGHDSSSLGLESEPVAVEEGDPLPLFAGEAPAAEPAVLYSGEEENTYPLYDVEASVVGAVEALGESLEGAVALGALVDEALSWSAATQGEGVIGTTWAGLFYGEEAGHAPAGEPGEETGSSLAGTESPLQDSAPQPVSPFTPPAGSSFSLSGGQVGVVALLFCVLASGLILLRREFKLLWSFCQLPKPNSVLLLPPERPG